jgi:hypothetical protein
LGGAASSLREGADESTGMSTQLVKTNATANATRPFTITMPQPLAAASGFRPAGARGPRFLPIREVGGSVRWLRELVFARSNELDIIVFAADAANGGVDAFA